MISNCSNGPAAIPFVSTVSPTGVGGGVFAADAVRPGGVPSAAFQPDEESGDSIVGAQDFVGRASANAARSPSTRNGLVM